jgi:hypothetical protein
MPQNKNNYYVSQFYLRNFSTDSDRKTVHLHNIKRNASIPHVGISGQCYRHYLYGEDGKLERGLGFLETAIAPVFRNMIATGTVPGRGTQQHGLIAQFISIQSGRTASKETQINKVVDLFAKYALAKYEPTLATALHKYEISLTNTAILNVQQSAIMASLLFDLEYKLLRAPIDTYFVTSDNPVVLFNLFFDRSHTRFTRGLACRGLQIYCPISPRYSLILYDRDLYRVGPVGCRCVQISSADVNNLNILEYLYAGENIYFSQTEETDGIRSIANQYYALRRSLPGRLVKRKESCGGTEKELATMEGIRPRFFPELASIKIKRRADKSRTTGIRDENWTRIVRDFAAAVDRGEANDFPIFAMKHPLASLVKSFR